MLLNPPNPPGRNIYRGYAGGFGIVGSIPSETLLPIYLLYGASALEKSGCEYDTLDAQAMRYDSSQTVDAVIRDEPNVLISWLSLPSIYNDLSLLNEIKEATRNVLLVGIGTVCNVMPEEILFKSRVELVVKGGYPHYNLISNLVGILKRNPVSPDTFDRIGGAVYLKEGKMVQSSIERCYEDLDQLVLDTYHQLPLNEYLEDIPDGKGSTFKCIPIVTSVGCPYTCVYCPYPIGYGRKLIHKSIMHIVDEIEFLKTNFGISGFLFRDQLFTHNRQRVVDLCDEIIHRDLNIKWFAEARADQVSEELLSRMKGAGCFRIHYGVETGSPEMLKKIGKPGVEMEAIKKTFRMTEDIGIATRAHMIIGLPGENQRTLEDSLDLLRDLNPDSVTLSILTPYPGTKLFAMAREQGLISTYDWSRYTGHDAIMGTGELSVDEVSRASKQMANRFRNFKLLHDSNYRRAHIKRLARAIGTRLLSLLKLRLRMLGGIHP
jgi:radical SAM superfamily enzyme YgiQ (UPF0313 family)